MKRCTRLARAGLETLLVTLVLVLVAGIGLARVAPALGRPVFVIQSGSMAPTIPVGAAVVVDPGGGALLRTGDVVAMRLPNATVFTHRVTRVIDQGGRTYVETKGDANASVDPELTPIDQVIGRVALAIPFAGYAVALLSLPSGLLTVLLAALTLAVATWLLDDDEGLPHLTADRAADGASDHGSSADRARTDPEEDGLAPA